MYSRIAIHMLETLEMSDDERSVEQRDEARTSLANVNLILEGMKKMQEELLTVRRGQEEAAERSERIPKKEHFSFLKRKGNEMQHHFNDKVAGKVAAAAIGKVSQHPQARRHSSSGPRKS